MDYRVASNIRGKSLSSLMTDKITSGKGVGSALGGAISDKLRARATGVKEKFDPMNIAKFMTGGSRLAPAILGRITGRSQSDINYFAGDKGKKGSYTQIPTSMATPGEGLGGSAVEVLNKMLSFMQRSREQDLKKGETSKQFIEEQKVEEQRRQNQFLNLLKEYTSLGTTSLVKAEEGNNIIETIKKMIDAFAQRFERMLNSIDFLKNPGVLKALTGLLLGPIGAAVAVTLAAAYGLKKLEEKLPNFSVRTPQEAQNILASGNAIAIQQEGGYDKLVSIIKNRPAESQKALDDFKAGKITEAQLNDLGGEKRLTEMAQQTGLSIPERVELPDRVQPRPTRRDDPNRLLWDQKYGKDYNVDGTRKVKQVPNTSATPAPAASPEGTQTPSPAATPVPRMNQTEPAVNSGANLQPVQQMPTSARMNDAVDENQNLNLTTGMNTQTAVAPVISSSSNSVDLPNRPIPATATVRDRTPILDHVLQQSLAPV